MITYIVGDLFQSPAQVLVNTVNTVGVMGKGIARDFKRIYPEMFKQYLSYCERDMFNIGQLWLYKTSHKWILNFPTKQSWRQPSKPEYIEAGLKKFAQTYDTKGITSISFPLLGCGNGELDWESQVRPLMEKYLSNIPIDISIHLYEKDDPFAPEHRNLKDIEKWLRGEPKSLAFQEFWADFLSLFNSLLMPRFTTLKDQSPFNASYDPNAEMITIETDQETHLYAKESFIELWQSVRDTGYFYADDLPTDFATSKAQIISLLAQLPYLKPVLIASRTQYTERHIGLQVVPQISNTKPEVKTIELA